MGFGKEIRIEVVSISEAEEYCAANNLELIKLYEGRGSNSGRLMMLAIDHNSIFDDYECNIVIDNTTNYEKEDTVVYCIVNDGKMYIADKKKCSNSVTFHISQAKKFKASIAFRKIHYMNLEGKYDWKAFKVK